MKEFKLDREEAEILDAIERGDWKAVKPNKAALARYVEIALNTLRKNQQKPLI